MFASLGLVATLLALGTCAPLQRASNRSKLLLVSFDGFRWNYDQDVDTPNLDAMAYDGVKARYITPPFVTQTSPCHFTLLTGKYIENHGVVHNMWYNVSTGQKLPYYNTQGKSEWWDNGSLPIWITAQRQGLKTASLFFPGGNATYHGEQVMVKRVEKLFHKYNNETEWRQNIDIVMKWFLEENLDFVALYFGEPDSTGHKYGPESQERKDMVSQVDRTVGYLRQRLEETGLSSNLNMIITSDHGMETVIKTDEIHLQKVQNFSFQDIKFELVDYGPHGLLEPKPGKLEQVYEALKNAHPKLHVYKKEEFPRRFRYANNTRITPLVLYGDPGYVIHGRIKVQINKGEHGFDNEVMNMKTIFRAVGPAFKKGLEVDPFESVNIYALLCELLEITPEPHDGSLSVTQNMLAKNAGASLECEYCRGTNNCTGLKRPCPSDQDACSISLLEVSSSKDKKISKSCASSETCKLGLTEVTHGKGDFMRESITCCKEIDCTPATPTFPPQSTEPNGKSCPGCFSPTGKCTAEVVGCTGSDTYCVSFVTLTEENVINYNMKGCISESSCGLLKTHKEGVLGNDAPIKNVTCTQANDTSTSLSPSSGFLLLALLLIKLLL
ncbi:ectonucleotide pyrophosphatase/phosphodiesterase family member 7 [Podarcis raffonei]|uniref:ectonucleotide pyrophosphatase/phosphodiesterase family member 7 n=1 Tax=Podarcis raffonei TaxID=65483 RepID=UPI00232983D0|nr:ectonucleotide pyrophosphatase/phosphodiesterase family member 7 [Podarcis raffonei]